MCVCFFYSVGVGVFYLFILYLNFFVMYLIVFVFLYFGGLFAYSASSRSSYVRIVFNFFVGVVSVFVFLGVY